MCRPRMDRRPGSLGGKLEPGIWNLVHPTAGASSYYAAACSQVKFDIEATGFVSKYYAIY